MRDCRKNSKKSVILLSGGADSATTLYWAKKRGYKLDGIIFNYNQKHKKEIKCAQKIAEINRIGVHHVKCELPWVRSSLTTKEIIVPFSRNSRKKNIPNTYVSGRNIIFLSYAFSLAESIGAKYIFIGAHVQDYSGYPDCRPDFLQKFQLAANSGMKKGNMKIMSPLINKTKKDIIKMGLGLGVPFRYTWSCYQGTNVPCEKCDSCQFRIKAFEDLGLVDPLLKHNK